MLTRILKTLAVATVVLGVAHTASARTFITIGSGSTTGLYYPTAVGMAKEIEVMVAAIIIAVGVMLFCADAISGFIEEHPTVKMLALSFLILIGVMLTAEAMGMHIKKGYIYFAMAFALLVEMLNMRARRRRIAKKASAAT